MHIRKGIQSKIKGGGTIVAYMKKFKTDYTPNVLLLGNGINRAFNSAEWNDLLRDMSRGFSDKEWQEVKNLPYPLMAVAVTEDHLGSGMQEQAESMLRMNVLDEQIEAMKVLFGCGFDAVILKK